MRTPELKSHNHNRRWHGLVGGMGIAILLLSGCGKSPAAPEPVADQTGYDSPQAVFDAEKAALAKSDHGAIFDLYSPEYQDVILSSVAFGAVTSAAITDKGSELKALFLKHGVDESKIPENPFATGELSREQIIEAMGKQQTEMLAAIKDKRAFFVDTVTWLEDSSPAGDLLEKEMEVQKKAQAGAELADLEITGNTAVGNRVLTLDGNTQKVPATFVRIDGSWYLHGAPGEAPIMPAN